MSRSALLLLLLAACAAHQQRREFRDGAPVRAPVVEPRTTYTPVGAGLSEYWAEPEAPKPERSPYKRVLPQTPETMKEDGLWAAKPRAMPEPTILGVVLPVPDIEPTLDRGGRWSCSARVARYAAEEVAEHGHVGLTEEQRKCIAARLVLICIVERVSHFDALVRADGGRDSSRRALDMNRRLWDYGKRVAAQLCDGVKLGRDAMDLMNAITSRRRNAPND